MPLEGLKGLMFNRFKCFKGFIAALLRETFSTSEAYCFANTCATTYPRSVMYFFCALNFAS